eukprot:Rmarinus@m.19544
MSGDVQALVNFYARVGYYRHIQTVCNEVLKKRTDDPVLLFWRAYGILMEGGTSECLRELEALLPRDAGGCGAETAAAKDVYLAALGMAIQAHKKFKVVDDNQVAMLEMRFATEETTRKETPLLIAATFFWHFGDIDQARTFVTKLNGMKGQLLSNAETLRGWIDLTSSEPRHRRNALQYFEAATSSNTSTRGDLEAILGKAKYHEMHGEYAQSLDLLNQVVVLFPWFLPALTEKVRVLMAMGDWDQALETSQRVLSRDSFNIDALRMVVTYLLAREARYNVAANRISDLIESIDRHEPKNPALYCRVAKPFARLCGRNSQILQLSLALVDRARKLDPSCSEYLTEYASQQLMLGAYSEALKSYRQASQMDDCNMDAMFGLIRCQMAEGNFTDAEEQLIFLREINTGDKPAEQALLSAMLQWQKNNHLDHAVGDLQDAMQAILENSAKTMKDYDYFVTFNCDMLLEIAKELLSHCGVEPMSLSDPPNPLLDKAATVLEAIIQQAPGALEAQLFLARTRYINNEYDAATRILLYCLKLEPKFAEAHIALAQIYLVKEKYKLALQTLEQALSHNFEVRDWPEYNLTRAQVLEAMGQVEEAIRLMEASMQLPGVKRDAGAGSRRRGMRVTLQDRVSVYLQLVRLYTARDQKHEATKVMQDAINEFQGTAEEVRVTIANANLSLARGDVEGALQLLRAVPKDNPQYMKAKIRIAGIYLEQRHDRRMYERTYDDMVEKMRTKNAYIVKGEAMLKIGEPEKAVKSFELALKEDRNDADLARRIGHALTMTHDYDKAINYYEKAVQQDPRRSILRHDLAELYVKLKRFEKAEKVLLEAQALAQTEEGATAAEELAMLMDEVKVQGLLAKVYKHGQRADRLQQAVEALLRARVIQNSVLSKIRGEQADVVRRERQTAAKICFTLAQYHREQHETDKAINMYNEALKHDEQHEESILALARLHLERNELELCQQQCLTLMNIDPNNEDASIMLSDIMFRKHEFDSAIYHYRQLLQRKPDNYVALSQLIQLLRRAGKLSDVSEYIKLAERASARSAHDAGCHYSKGLYERYMNNPHDALREFNLARKHGEWGERAIYNMVEIYLNPDNETTFEEASDGGKADNAEHLRAAERLLNEVRTRPRPLKHRVLECYALMATKQTSKVERAIQMLMEILNKDMEYVPALLALSQACMQLKQVQKARNQLKAIGKLQYSPEFADEFERAWLLLSDIYVNNGKYDLAQELCKRCLNKNRMCSKAAEYMGLIMEKEQAYRDAADYYEQAWRFENESSASVGYKLAFNYLKAKRFVSAIDVCNKVLAIHPRYPKIQKEILEKARMSLRQ